MKSLQIAVLGVFLLTAQTSTINAQESSVTSDISDVFDIQLESGEIFTIPTFLPGIIEEESGTEILQEKKKESSKEDKKPLRNTKEGEGRTQKKINTTVSASRERIVLVTAYSSTADQTDSSPCITANGFNVCQHNKENVIAANFLPFGTRVRLPDIYGEKVFTVQDRMHRRHSSRVDIWMKTRSKAKQFGVKHSKVEIVSEQVAVQQ